MAQQQSLFGPSIYDIQQQQMQQDQANALAQARLTPYQSIRAGMGMAGTQAGRSIAGLFGVEDPQLKQASAREELKRAVNSQWDGQDPVEAYRIMAREASRLGLTQEAIAAAAQVKAAEESKAKTELGKMKTEADIGLTQAQTEASKKASERETAREARAAEEFDYKKSQRALDEATKQLTFVSKVQDINNRNTAAETAQIALDKAKAELAALPSGFYKRQYELKLEKLEADIKAAKALATYRERERAPEGKRKMAEIPIRDDIGTIVGKTIVYSDGTRETVYGNAAPSSEDTAAQAARGIVPGSNITMEQLIAERNRRKQQPGAK
jgi:hypothetical protein